MSSSPDPDLPRVRLRSDEWRVAGIAAVLLGVVVAAVAANRWPDDHSFVHLFFAAVGVAIAAVGLALAMSSVELSPGAVVVVNGWRRHAVPTHEVRAVTIVGIGDRRGADGAGPPPRATWVVEIVTAEGPLLAFGLMANRKPANRDRLLVVTQSIARHCGLSAGPP